MTECAKDSRHTVLVAIPAYGSPELTDAVLGDLDRDGSLAADHVRVVIVDNGGDYELPKFVTRGVSVFRSGGNLRWIGSVNWALRTCVADGFSLSVVLNNDIRLSTGFLDGLTAVFTELDDVAIAAACYDDFWLHQRAKTIPKTAADYVPRRTYRDVSFCDGTAIAFDVAAVVALGGLDADAFPRHGYGSDIDLAIRARGAGLRCVVTEGAYVSHLRRATMNRLGETSEGNRAEILTGLDAKWGDGWRAEIGLSPDAFPPFNTGSAASWYLEAPRS